MTSAINYSNIDATYPVPGQDNDSQGFRNNFNAIKVGLQTASSEISSLQDNTAKLNNDNDFGGTTIIKNAIFSNNVGNVYTPADAVIPATLISGNIYQLSTTQGDYVQLNVQTTATIQLTGLEANGYRNIRFEVTPTTSTTITFSSDKAGGAVKTTGALTLPYTFPSTVIQNTYFFDVWTVDGGQTLYVNQVGDNGNYGFS